MNKGSISNYLQHYEQILHTIMDNSSIPAARVKEAMEYALFPGGKRLRPTLVYLCGELIDTPLPCLDAIAAAIELTHCYSLVHDDLPAMDNDDLRRGKPSCHRAYDEATAILVGDGLQALAIEVLVTHLPQYIDAPKVIEVVHELVKASGPSGMISGQSLDLSELGKLDITEAQLRTIHSLKTGKLISACINMVLAASSADEVMASALRNYAEHLGLVFQMQDDYLDAYAETEVLGKGRSSDNANKKMTFTSLYAQAPLFALINHHFQLAKNALIPFEHQATTLLTLTESLQQRGYL